MEYMQYNDALGVYVERDPQIIEGYLRDASNTKGHCEGLLRPTNAKEVSQILRYCQQHNIPLTVTAQRTSTTGAPVPYGGYLLSTEKMSTIYSDTEVDGGVILGEYQKMLEDKGWLFPPDPTSRQECSVGGAIACNASGARSFRYGATKPWVEAVEVVLANGDIISADRNTPIPSHWPKIHRPIYNGKNVTGYEACDNLLDLMIGQEGTLGIITKAKLRIIPNPHVLGLLVFFGTLSDCLNFVQVARTGAERPHSPAMPNSLNPRAIEFFDTNSIALMRSTIPDIPEVVACGLFMEIESTEEDFPQLTTYMDVLQQHNALVDDIIVADTEQGRAKLYKARHAIPAGVNEIVIANGMPKVGTDFAVPDDKLAWMMDNYAEIPLPYVLFGHIGDSHLHANMLPKNQEELKFAKEIYRELAMIAVEYGGTVSAEHGIGKIKVGLLEDMLGKAVIDGFRALKKAIDANSVLGRGTIFTHTNQQ